MTRNSILLTAFGAAATVTVAAIASRTLKSKPVVDGAVIVITGGSRGLGLAIASRFAGDRRSKNSVRLVLAARSMEELQKAQEALLARHDHLQPDDFYLVAGDLSKPEEAERLISETMARFGQIDVLVNNAGIIEVGPVESQTLEIFEHTMKVNFFAALYTTWAALPFMRKQAPLSGRRRAAIVNIASIGGKIAVPHMLPYSAAKFALVGFSEGLHAEVRHQGIRVTTVCPGLMRTGGEAHAKFVGNVDAERRWFMLAAKTPGIAVSLEYAANRVYEAALRGSAEITISPQAFLAARYAGLCPGSTQYANALFNRYILPKPLSAPDTARS